MAMWPDSQAGSSTATSLQGGRCHISGVSSLNCLTPRGNSQKRICLSTTCSLPRSPESSRMSVPGASVVEQ